MTPTNRIWGYARASTAEQTLSPEAQKERILKRARPLLEAEPGLVMGEIVCENESARKTAYNKRPGFVSILDRMSRGDVLLVWKLDRLDRDPFRMANCAKLLVEDLGIRVIPEEGTLDVSSAAGVSNLFLQGIVSKFFTEGITTNTKAAMQHMKANGIRYTTHPPLGHEYHEFRGHKTKRGKQQKIFVLSVAECRDIAEIVSRRRKGEKWVDIARDFLIDKRRRACGRPWVKLYGKRRDISTRLIRDAYAWGEEQLEKTGSIGGMGCSVPKPVNLTNNNFKEK